MAFWGIEIKPGKSYTHQFDEARGRLHVSQAVLGSGASTKRSVVQCNVGDKSPVLLCSLLPEKIETCPLDLEFEEDDEVVFSVVGPTSVHLTGYYLGTDQCFDQHGEDSDSSYGEDIAEIDTDQSSDYDTEDELEDDFIDDSDMFPSAARPNSGVKIEEIVDDEKPANGKSTRKHLTEKNHLSESDDGDDDSQLQTVTKGTGAPVLESEDEDGFPLSLTSKSKSAVKNVDAKENSEKKTTEAGRMKEKKEKKKKKQENNSDQVTGLKRKIDAVDQVGEPQRGAKQIDDSTTPSGEVAADKRGKSKKKRKEKAEKKNPEVEANVPTLETEEKETADQNAAIDDNKSNALNDQKSQLEDSKTDNMDQDVAVGDEPKEDIPNAKSLVVDADSAAADSQSVAKKKKKKKKKSKTQDNDAADANQVESGNAMTEVKETLEQRVEVQPSKARTFSNGLVIEELSMGKPDGKRASPGNRVSVCYIGRLKKNGQIFDSNIGQRPFKFRLGIGQVIKGWDVGVAGMRIGDKRRLTIPPSMGYGSKGAGKIPANAWLVFDVELVDVLNGVNLIFLCSFKWLFCGILCISYETQTLLALVCWPKFLYQHIHSNHNGIQN